MAAKTLAVFQPGFRRGKQGTGQQTVPAVVLRHFFHGGGPAAQVHVPLPHVYSGVKAAMRRRARFQGFPHILVAFGGPLGPGGVAAGSVHIHRQHIQMGDAAKNVGAGGVHKAFQNFVAGSANGNYITAHRQSPLQALKKTVPAADGRRGGQPKDQPRGQQVQRVRQKIGENIP